MKNVIIACTCLIASPSFAADSAPNFIIATVADIGRPYTVLGGDCAFGTGASAGFDMFTPELESAATGASVRLMQKAQKQGGDAVVGAIVSTHNEDHRNGVLVCGTIVKFK